MSILRGRTMPARVVRALAAAGAAGVVGAAACVASAAPAPATQPTQQELLEQIQALRAQVERLEAEQHQAPKQAQPPAQTQSQQDAPATQPSPAFAAEPSAAGEVERDAARRSQFLETSGNFTAGYTKGKFTIQDEKGDFVFHPQIHFAPRFVVNDRENSKHAGSDQDTQTGFEIRRLKLGFDGNVFTPNLTYLFLWATDRNTGNLVLEEAWAKYAFRDGAFKNFFVKGGQFKDPFAHESLTSSKRLLAADRSLLNNLFTGGDNYVQGASFGWDDGPEGSPFRTEVAFTDGANAFNQNFQDFPTTKANFGVAGRLELLAFGKWADYEDWTTVGSSPNMLVLGVGADLTEAGDTDVFLHTVDAQFERGKFGLYGAFLGRSVQHQVVTTTTGTTTTTSDVGNTYDWGFIVQAAYMVNPHLEPFVRYDYIDFDEAGLPAGFTQNKVHEATAGVNYYWKGHAAKMTVDVTYLPNGTPFADTGADILQSNDEAEFVLRTQFQLLL